MFEFLKKIFLSEKEPEQQEVSLSELEGWFTEKVSQLNFNEQFQEYFQQIQELRNLVKEKLTVLEKAEISKEHKGVEERVKNIVKGHRDNYVREIERFLENLSPTDKEKFASLDDYQEVLKFNQGLDKEMDELARRTAKGYQAAQHLFFNEVENVFKLIAKLNLLVKNFNKKVKKEVLHELEETKDKIKQLHQDIEKKNNFEKEVKEKENVLEDKNKELGDKEKQLKGLKEGKDYQEYQELENKKEQLEKQIKDNDDKVFSFFSKLNKAFRKYERVTLDNSRLIKEYLEDNIKAFFHDEELKIKEVLLGLKKSLDGLQFDDKQKNNFLELIKKSEEGYLEELSDLRKRLKEDKEKLVKEINENKIVKEIEDIEKELNGFIENIQQTQTNISELSSKSGKIDLEKIKEEIKGLVKKNLNVEIKIMHGGRPLAS